MTSTHGYVLVLDSARYELLVEHVDSPSGFGEPVTDFVHSRNAPLLCFVVSPEMEIAYVTRAKKGLRAGTGMRRLNVLDATPVEPGVSIERVMARLPKRLHRWAYPRLNDGGLLPPGTFLALVEILMELSPSSRALLSRFGRDRAERIGRLSARTRQALAGQKVAVSTALALAGLPREPLQEWDPGPTTSLVSFLHGLPFVRLREDALILKDLMTLPGHELIRPLPFPAAVFEGHGTRLTVLLANRLPLEELTGTDLIYFNETLRSFVMVQYKAMEDENDGAVFRLPDAQLERELTRMNATLDELGKHPPTWSLSDFRLTDNPFFLKLCPRIVFDPNSTSLVPGMYIPLDYWKLLSEDPGIEGPRGGKAVSFANVGRYFDNTEFVSLVAKAWVGTTSSQGDVLQGVFEATLSSGKAIAIGIRTESQ
jgi:hypothetical protein